MELDLKIFLETGEEKEKLFGYDFETDEIPVTPCTATARVNRVCLCNICSRKATVCLLSTSRCV